MSASAKSLESAGNEKPGITILGWVGWLVPQIASLALSAGQIRFSYRWIDPPQKWAVEQLLVVQICTSLFVVRLMKSTRFCVCSSAVAATMLALAHTLAIGSMSLPWSIIAMSAWLAGLRVVSQPKPRPLATVVLMLWTFGGIVLAYCAAEFAGATVSAFYSPIIALLQIGRDGHLQFAPWISLAMGMGILSLVNFLFREDPLRW